MKTAKLLETRRGNWAELEALCRRLETAGARTAGPTMLGRFAALYRTVCADLALAEGSNLPGETVLYLHQLTARAHNQLYRSRRFNLPYWGHVLLHEVPVQLMHDGCVRLAFVLFWGLFLMAMLMGYASPEFAERHVGAEMLRQMEEMHRSSTDGRDAGEGSMMTAFYINHNASIGLRCFAFGLILGVGGIAELISNAVILGTVFGHMATVEDTQFFDFVTAHGPFELTAIVLSAAAGMRLGFAMIVTNGLTRSASLRKAGRKAMPMAALAVILFMLAGMIEAFLSPSPAPYWLKAVVAAASTGLMLFYFLALGFAPGAAHADR